MDLRVVRAFEVEADHHLPGFRVEYKNESLFMRALGAAVWPFNKAFMTTFTTTIGKTVYFPSRAFYQDSPERTFSILAHEFVHALDDEKHGLWFKVSYLFPQLLFVPLCLLGLVGLFFSWWAGLLLLAAVVCLAPWPARWRAKWEVRGYTMNLAVRQWVTGSTPADQRARIAKNFYGPNYYFMVWGEEKASLIIDESAGYAASPRILLDRPFLIVHSFMRTHGLLG